MKNIVTGSIINIIGGKKIKFIVEPIDTKRRYYDDINDLKNDFSVKELKGAYIGVMYGVVTVGELNTDKVLDELF